MVEMQKWFGVANMFSAGVFLAGGMLDLMPSANDNIRKAIDPSYPLGPAMAMIGFSFILCLEEFVMWIQSNKPPNEGSQAVSQSSNKSYGSSSGNTFKLDELENELDCCTNTRIRILSMELENQGYQSVPTGGNSHNEHDHYDIQNEGVGAYAIVFALSVHGIFEAVALGTMDDMCMFRALLIAIAAHAPIGNFALAVSLIRADVDTMRFWICVMIASLVTPFGVFIGMSISAGNLVQGMMQGLATGTFIYVGVVEILPKEMSHHARYKKEKLLAFLAGCSFMAGVVAIPSD